MPRKSVVFLGPSYDT